MKLVHLVCLSSILALAACSNDSDYSAQPQSSQAPVAQKTVEQDLGQAQVEEYIKPEDVKSSAGNSTSASNPSADAKPAPSANQALSMEQAAAQTINNSNLTPAQKAEMNEKVQALMAAKGNPIQMAAAGNALISFAAGAAGPAGNIPGFGLVDAAAAVAAVQDLIAAIIDLDAAGIQAAIMDLIAALVA